jgi:hypothetical protein
MLKPKSIELEDYKAGSESEDAIGSRDVGAVSKHCVKVCGHPRFGIKFTFYTSNGGDLLTVRPKNVERFQIANRGKVVQVALRFVAFSQVACNAWSILLIQMVTK